MTMSWEAAAGCAAMPQVDPPLGHLSSELSTISQDLPRGSKRRPRQMSARDEALDEEEVIDDLSNSAAEKKRRLTSDQVKYLEMSFIADLKLEPQRKALIAKHLGIRPRQVAIWFQNRRARWKNKQLEQEYEALKDKYEAEVKEKENHLKEHQQVLEENQKLQAEVARLKALLQDANASIAPSVETDGLMIKEEELSGKSEVASPTTKSSSDGQSEMQDSGQSYCASPEAAVAQAFDLHVPSVKLEPDCAPLPPADDSFGCHHLLEVQRIANGFDLEFAYHFFNYEDPFHGLPWNGGS